MKKLLLLTLTVGVLYSAKAQTGSDQLGGWYRTTMLYGLSDKVSYEGFYYHRQFKLVGDFQQNVIRNGLRYKIDKQHFISGGFDFLNTEAYSDAGFHHEYRPWVHFGQKSSLGRWTIANRYRFEGRFLKASTTACDFQVRFRYRLTVKAPLNGPKIEPGVVYFLFFDEVFLNFVESPYNQNWMHTGLGYKVSPKLAVELGYFNQHINSEGFHRAHLTLGWSFLKKMKVIHPVPDF